MTGLHNEIRFEEDICAHLAAHGWLYAEGSALIYAAVTCKIGVRGLAPVTAY